jgi:hypothetical protein
MSDDEILIMIIAGITAIIAAFASTTLWLHPLFVKNNYALGLSRLSVITGLVWISIVIANFADESVEGVYEWFYLLLGYAQIMVFGQLLSGRMYGVRLRVDIFERKNLAAAIYLAACTVSAGLIAGGSLWGDAGPETDDEGGWWIPMSFFLLGWICLVISSLFYNKREDLNVRKEIVQNRNIIAAKRAGAAMICTSIILTDAVAGDFFGWQSSLISFFGIAGIHLVHEFMTTLTSGPLSKEKEQVRGPMTKKEYFVEVCAYIGMAIIAWMLNRIINLFLGW